jgi:hypothetical protein
VFPNRIITSLHDVVSARENNIALLNMSWMNEHIVVLQPEIAEQRANGEHVVFFSLFRDKTSMKWPLRRHHCAISDNAVYIC